MEVGVNVILTAIDVTSLYTKVKHHDGIKAVKWALRRFSDLKSIQRKLILQALEFGMTRNYFWYGEYYYF